MQKKYFGTCTIPGCSEPYLAKGLCRNHYTSKWRKEHPNGANPQKCKIDGCENLAHTSHKGMCKKHYRRMFRHGTSERLLGYSGKCYVEGCNNIGTGNPRICSKHRHNQERYGNPMKTAKDMPKPLIQCAVPTCTTVRVRVWRKTTYSYCERHMNILYKHGLSHQKFTDIFGEPPYICYLCGKVLDLNSRNVQIDHVIPISLGGQSITENLKLTCKRCNQSKRNMTTAEFISMCKDVYSYALLDHAEPT